MLPAGDTFEPNKQYVRDILATQCDLTSLGTGFVMDSHKRFQENLARVNSGGVPQEQVIELHRERFQGEYRLQTDGEHPVTDLRETAAAH